jgi:hypothetical protein
VGIEAVVLSVDVDVAVGQDLELGLVVAAGGIDGEEDGPGDDETDEADGGEDTEEAQEEVGIEALVLEGIGVGDLPEGPDPVEEALGQLWTPFAATDGRLITVYMGLVAPIGDKGSSPFA